VVDVWLSLLQAPPPAANIGAVKIPVLVVDDDAGFRSLAVRILRASGLHVMGEAATCAAGLAAAHELRPPAILVDVRLPDGDGIALARELRELPWRPRVLLTSSDPDVAADLASADGAPVAFVPKADLASAPLWRLLGAGA
jgi:CheY-like chemotaxis protein